MPTRPNTYSLKITVARLLELSYARNEGITTSILREVGPASISVDSRCGGADPVVFGSALPCRTSTEEPND